MMEANLKQFENSSPNFKNRSISESNLSNFDLLNNFDINTVSTSNSSLGGSKKRLSVNPTDFNDISIDETDDEEEELTPSFAEVKATSKYLGVNQVLDEETKEIKYYLKDSNISAELNFDFDNNKLIINGKDIYSLTRNLWKLITTDRATQYFIDGLNKQEIDTYYNIIKKYYDLKNFTCRQKRNKK